MARDYDDRYDDDRDDRDDRGPDRIFREAKAKVNVASIGLIIVGVISLLSVGYGIVNYLSFDEQRDEQLAKIDKDPATDAKTKQMQKDILVPYFDAAKIATPPLYAVALVIAAITILSGVRLRQFRSLGLVKAGAVLSMLPCVSGCCILGLIFGFVTFNALKDPVVKKAFKLTAEAANPPESLED